MSEAVVVLSPGRANPDGRFADYGDDGSYIGGQIRMDAAVQMVRDRPEDTFFMVGGCDVETLWTPHSVKAMHMSRFVCEAVADEEPEAWRRVGPVPSLPCTYHNFVAVLNALNTGYTLFEEGTVNVDVLTNAYHIPRSQEHAEQAKRDVLAVNPDVRADVAFTWHAAENVLGLCLAGIRKENPDAYQKRIDMESDGLSHIAWGLYKDSCRRKYSRAITQLLVSHGDSLLAPFEYRAWGIHERGPFLAFPR